MNEEIEEEIFKPVIGFEGIYEISNLGRVKVLPREWISGTKGNCLRKRGEFFLAQKTTKFGYFSVKLCKDNKRTYPVIHRLIALAFIPNPDNKPMINHIDGNKKNNRISNLEWCTGDENMKHAARTGLIPKGKDHHDVILQECQVYRLRWIKKNIKVEHGYWTKVAKSLNVSLSAIMDVIHDRSWPHIIVK